MAESEKKTAQNLWNKEIENRKILFLKNVKSNCLFVESAIYAWMSFLKLPDVPISRKNDKTNEICMKLVQCLTDKGKHNGKNCFKPGYLSCGMKNQEPHGSGPEIIRSKIFLSSLRFWVCPMTQNWDGQKESHVSPF